MKQISHMKKKTLILLIGLLPFICSAQIFTTMGYGWSFEGHPIATWAVGYDKGLLNIQGEIRPSMTFDADASKYMGFRLSANLVNPDEDYLYIQPGIFYGYNFRSWDKRSLNKWSFAPTLRTMILITQNGGMALDAMFIDKKFQTTINILYTFTNRDKLY